MNVLTLICCVVLIAGLCCMALGCYVPSLVLPSAGWLVVHAVHYYMENAR